jgi:hypothetical protein
VSASSARARASASCASSRASPAVLLGQRGALARGGGADPQLLQLGDRRLRPCLGVAARRVLGRDPPARLAQLRGQQRRPLRRLVGVLAQRALRLGLRLAPRRALLAHAGRQVIRPARGRLGPPRQRLGLAELLLQLLDPRLGLLGAPLRRARDQRRVRALLVERLGPRAQDRQLGRPRLGDLTRLVDRGQPRLGRPRRARRPLGLLARLGDLALALGQRVARLMGDLDRRARLLGAARRPLAVLPRAFLLGGRALAGPDALLGQRVDRAGPRRLGAPGDLGRALRLGRRLLGDRVRLGRPALRVLARRALLGQPRVQRGDVRRTRQLADVEAGRRRLGRAAAQQAPAAALGLRRDGRRLELLDGRRDRDAPAAAPRRPWQVGDPAPAPGLQGEGDARAADQLGRRAERGTPLGSVRTDQRRDVVGPRQRREAVRSAPVVEQQQRRAEALAGLPEPATSDPQQHRAGTCGDLLEGLNLEARSHGGSARRTRRRPPIVA